MINGQVKSQTISGEQISNAAVALTKDKVVYDPSYFSIEYPNGDIPAGKGVCTDVVIRTMRRCGIDLQQLVHEDMKARFGAYPQNWGQTRPDSNIDHRRVPNLQTYFKKYWKVRSILISGSDYSPGDVATWNLGSGITHIGVVSNRMSLDNLRPLVVHNIGAGQVLEDCLFNFEITGHFRYP